MSKTPPSPSAPAPPQHPRAARRARPQSLLAKMAIGLLGSKAACLGLAWVGTLIVLAVFAPWIANSHPIYCVIDGQAQSPLLKHLTPVDVILLAMFIITIGLACLRFLAGRTRVLIGVAALLAVTVASYSFVSPPQTQNFKQYRQAIEAGRVQTVWYTPIAYSPADYQYDRLENVETNPRLLPPSLEHPMGTSKEGADVASRMIHACRIALAVGFIATGIAVTIGIFVGGIMGYFSGRVDLLGMRFVEVFAAIPVIFLLIMVCAFYGRNIYIMMTIIGLTGWVGYALFIRAEFLKIRKMDYVQAARAVGVPLPSILMKHMLPNGVTPILVLASFGVASAILYESTLSFIGLGLLPHEPSWGQLLKEAQNVGASAWWLMLYPGLAIFLTVYAYNLIGEALRDIIDPRAVK